MNTFLINYANFLIDKNHRKGKAIHESQEDPQGITQKEERTGGRRRNQRSRARFNTARKRWYSPGWGCSSIAPPSADAEPSEVGLPTTVDAYPGTATAPSSDHVDGSWMEMVVVANGDFDGSAYGIDYLNLVPQDMVRYLQPHPVMKQRLDRTSFFAIALVLFVAQSNILR